VGKPNQAFITINGKKYDARTGQLVGSSHAAAPKRSAPKVSAPHAATPKRVVSDIARTPAPSLKRRQQSRSQTLMRTAVKKPTPTTKAHPPKAPAHVAKQAPKKPTLPRIQHFDVARHTRAAAVKKSELISKFNNSGIVQHPIATAETAVRERIEHLPVRPAPVVQAASTGVQSMLERGLKNAQSHTETFKPSKAHKKKTGKKGKGRLTSLAAGSLAAVLLFGFIAFQNVPNISVRYAAARSGVQASLPGYKPAGFALSNRIQYNPGQITLNFASTTDERAFKITQRETAWNSEALHANYVLSQSDQIQKYEDRGRTIFIYGNNNATWVNGGVWYDINGDSHLNSDQLIRIATSM